MALVVTGLGSNIDAENNIRFALAQLAGEFGNLQQSPVYQTKPVGFEGADFLNMVVGFHSLMTLSEIKDVLRAIEAKTGREHGVKECASRTLDIDILLFGDQDLHPEHNIPRDEITSYSFVLKPLAVLFPNLHHPSIQQSYEDLWSLSDFKESELKLVTL